MQEEGRAEHMSTKKGGKKDEQIVLRLSTEEVQFVLALMGAADGWNMKPKDRRAAKNVLSKIPERFRRGGGV